MIQGTYILKAFNSPCTPIPVGGVKTPFLCPHWSGSISSRGGPPATTADDNSFDRGPWVLIDPVAIYGLQFPHPSLEVWGAYGIEVRHMILWWGGGVGVRGSGRLLG